MMREKHSRRTLIRSKRKEAGGGVNSRSAPAFEMNVLLTDSRGGKKMLSGDIRQQYTFRCGDGHTFVAEGKYSEFDIARKCARLACYSPAFMIVDGMASLDFACVADDRSAYAQHNVTFTGESREGESSIGFSPNSHADQCQCEKCCRHRKRALVTEVADKGKDVHVCL